MVTLNTDWRISDLWPAFGTGMAYVECALGICRIFLAGARQGIELYYAK
jgi:hypothetical protein